MSRIANRMECIDSSGIRKVFALAAKLDNPINLSIGQPDYDVSEVVKREAVSQINAGFNSYTQTQGIEELRDAIGVYYEGRFQAKLENVMVTSGVSGGLFLSLLATVNPGDEVLFADPYFVMYKHLVNLLGGISRPIDTYPDFKLKAEAVEAAITPKTKVLLVNSPSNPTGVTLNDEELQAIADVARKHNLIVVSDEIYEQFCYDGKPASMAGKYENAIILNGFSKMAAMTGWRVGYAAGPADLIGAMTTLQQYTFVCAPSFAQKAAITALTEDPSERIEAYRRKRDIVTSGLSESFGVVKPGGAFYVFPKSPNGSAEVFVNMAIENNVLIIPGNVFSEKDTHFRISFAASDDDLKKGIDVLNRIAEEA